jgi:hypothetical protein
MPQLPCEQKRLVFETPSGNSPGDQDGIRSGARELQIQLAEDLVVDQSGVAPGVQLHEDRLSQSTQPDFEK